MDKFVFVGTVLAYCLNNIDKSIFLSGNIVIFFLSSFLEKGTTVSAITNKSYSVCILKCEIILHSLRNQYANIAIDGEDDSEFAFDFVDEGEQPVDERWCIVARFLTEHAIDFDTMRHIMASLFQPSKGMRKKLRRTAAEEGFWAFFKYEYVPTFCFICGILGHSDKFYPQLFVLPADQIVKPYGVAMRAQPRWRNHLIGAKWLRTRAEEDMSSGDTSRSNAEKVNSKSGVILRNQSEGDKCGKAITHNIPLIVGHIDMGHNVEIGEDSQLTILDIKRRRTNELMSSGPCVLDLSKNGPTVMSAQDKMEVYDGDVSDNGASKNGLLNHVIDRLKVVVGFEGMLSVDVRGHNGGIALLWRFTDEVEFLGTSVNNIDLKVTMIRVFDYHCVTDGISPIVTSLQKAELLQHVTPEEVKKAMFQMHPEKSLGPDGMTPGFYQKYWDVVGSDRCHTPGH
uniref:Zinc knuckle CX2CX4HX4C domain-containing protein n=1 Tax=Cannabis sativa TaxID=3483 RepID=A0A803QB91_CANSA